MVIFPFKDTGLIKRGQVKGEDTRRLEFRQLKDPVLMLARVPDFVVNGASSSTGMSIGYRIKRIKIYRKLINVACI